MDKVKINTQIVQMRKYVKQAKIHVISKYVKQAKLLQNRRGGAENQILKCKRKAERLLLEIAILKKIKPDSVSKMVLSKAKDWKAILAQKNVSLEDRCFAMLANFEAVQKEVDKFYVTNQELVPKLATLIDSIGSTTKRLKQNKGHPIKKPNNAMQISKPNESVKEKKEYTEKYKQNLVSLKREESADIEVKKKELLHDLNSPKPNSESESDDDVEEEEMDNSVTQQNLNNEEKSNSEPERDDDVEEEEMDNSVIQQNLNNEKSRDTKNNAKDNSEKYEARSDFKKQKQGNSIKKVITQRKEAEGENEIGKQRLKKEKKSTSVKNMEKSELLSNSESSNTDQDPGSETDEEEGRELPSPNRPKNLEKVNFGKGVSPKHAKKDLSISDSKDLNMERKNKQNSNLDKVSKTAYKKLDIQSRLAAIANNTYPRPDLSAKKKSQSKLKAIAVFDLNELQDLDEIPVGSSNATAEESSTSKKDSFLDTADDKPSSEGANSDEDSDEPSVRKKDPFFLTGDGQVVSESGDSDTESNQPSYGKRQFGRSNGKDSNNEFFNPKFSGDSYRGNRPPFAKSNFQNDKGRNFQRDKGHNFQRDKAHNFQRDKGHNFQRDKGYSFKDNKSFKRERHDSDFNKNKKFKPMGKGRFDEKPSFQKHEKKEFATRHFKEKTHSNQHSKAITQKPQMKPFQKNKSDDKPLHPSWEAKKKMKEAGKTKFQGKRIVFTD